MGFRDTFERDNTKSSVKGQKGVTGKECWGGKGRRAGRRGGGS